MKSLSLIFLLLFFSGEILFSQTTTSFRTNYNVGMIDLPGSAIESHTPGNFVFSGTNAGLPIVGSITELDPAGAVVWSKSYSGGISYQLNDLKKDPAGGYYGCGGSSSSSGVFLRVDANGNYVDANKFDLANATGEYLSKIVKTSDGGYVAAGYSYGYDPDGAGGMPKNDSTSALVVKFDANGNRLWHRVFRFYSDAGMTNPILNDASFVDVVEVSDGYLFVGRYEVDDVININSDGDDITPDDAIILKTTTAGAITYLKQLDSPSSNGTQTSKTFNSISKTAAGLALVSGYDGNARPLMLHRFPASGGWVVPTWSQKYGVGGILGYNVMEPSQFFETQDGKYAVMGMYINPLAFDFSQYLMKFDPANYAIEFTKKYTFSLAVILPVGQQVSDGGYLSLSTTMAGTGFDYHVIKTDPTGATSGDCPAGTLSPTTSAAPNVWADPHYQSWTADVVDNSNTTPVIASISPVSTIQCQTIVSPCTPPAAATTVTATPNPICAGQSASITATGPATGVIYNVYAAATGGTSLGTTPFSVSPAATTTYYVETVNDSDPACVSTTRTPVTVTVNPVPTATAGSNSPICVGSNLNLTSNTVAGATYSWTGPNGYASTDEDPVITGATASHSGTYTLTITNGGCTSTPSTVTVTVNSAPTPVTNASINICEGEDLVISSGNASPTATYSWTGPNGFASTNEQITIPAATSAHAGTYTVTVTEGACAVEISNNPVVVDAVPVVVVGSNSPICAGADLNLTSSGGTTYSWTGPDSYTSTSQNPTISNAQQVNAGTYTVTAESANGCTATDQVVVTITTIPTATAGSNSPICVGATLNLTSNTVVGATYSWTGPNGYASTDEDPVITGATASHSGTYTLTITVAGCPSVPSTVDVDVNGAPTPVTNTSINICEGEDLIISSGNTSPTATYSWTGPNGFASTNEQFTIPAATSAHAGTYTVTVTEGACAVEISNNPVVVDAVPVVVAGSNSPICEGADLNLTSSGGTTYSWTGPDSFTSTSQNPTISNAQQVNGGTYTVTAESANGCTATGQVVVAISTPETISVAGTDVLCNGGSTGSATVTTTGAGPYTYAWSPSGGTGATASNLAEGTYTVNVDNGNGCISTETVVIGEPAAISLVTSSTTTSCTSPTGSASVVASGGAGNYTYSWSPSGGNAATASNIGVGIYTVTVTDGNLCTQTATVNVSSANGPTVNISSSSNVSCFGLTDGSATAAATGGTPGYTYAWSPSGGSAATASNLGAGDYTVTVTDNAGCNAVQTVTITAPAQLTVAATGTDAGCGATDGSVTANATGGNGPYTYSWQPSGTGQALTNVPGGIYTVTATDASGCTATASHTVNVTGSLAVDVSPTTSSIDAGQSVNLSVTVSPAVPGVIYNWSPSSGLSCTNCANPVATPGSTTVYTVTATSPDGCSGTATALVDVKVICGEHFIPTIFSPNGDGNNDEVCVMGGCVKEMNLRIYDRWGEKVFESTEQGVCWDGTFKGKLMNPASFVYVVEIEFIDGRTINENGNISLVR